MNGPQPKRSQGLDDAKFIRAPKPKSPTSTHVPIRETVSGSGMRARPPLASTSSAAKSHTAV
ncbi:MAG: hypothetical protein JWN06_2651 [Propionibacteriaceae bacterium]|nr:hypothetical protein [Propionibacteriaceae bacterium]